MNPIPVTAIHMNWAYFGLAVKIRITAMPRIITAVLKLLAPTSPTTGRANSMILNNVVSFPIFLTFFVTSHARNTINATFTYSDG